MLVRSIFLHHTHPQRDRCVEVELENGPHVFRARTGRFVSVCFTQFNLYTQSTTKLCIIDHSLQDLTAAPIGADLVEMGSRLTFSHSQTALTSSTQGVISS